jgi:uncharacterized protein (TIGR02145 family)
MLDDAITGIIYATANASGATVTGLPAGVSGTWAANTVTISGAPSATGTFNYTVTTTNSNGCSNAAITGTITVNLDYVPVAGCSPAAFSLGTIAFANADTYTRNGIILSAPVTASGCQKTNYDGGSSGAYNADCRDNPGYDGDLFSWCMVTQYAAQLCPSPWRVPSAPDYMMYANGSTSNTNATTDLHDGVHGWSHGGNCCNESDGLMNRGQAGYYWTSATNGDTRAQILYLSAGKLYPNAATYRQHGLSLRCVR